MVAVMSCVDPDLPCYMIKNVSDSTSNNLPGGLGLTEGNLILCST